MRRDELMKPDLLCKALLLGSVLTIGVALVMVILAASGSSAIH
jgi:hypothetical protein